MVLKIDQGIPIPEGLRGRKRKYPFPDMEIGDSFAVPSVDSIRVRAAASYWGLRHKDVKFSILKTPDGYRCWRVQ